MLRRHIGLAVLVLCVSGCSVQSMFDEAVKTDNPDSKALIAWASEHVIALESLDSSAAGTDLEPLRETLGSARLVGLGESRHDTREQLLLKGRLVRHLIEDLGFRALILEESLPHAESLDRYVMTGEGDLRDRQIPLDVSPTSNVCLGVAPSLAEHPLPRLLDEGLFVTLNSDDPPMFNTTLTEEYLKVVHTMNLGLDVLEQLVQNGIGASALSEAERRNLSLEFRQETARLRSTLGSENDS
ncbi:MAG: hypothetical protein KAJ78_04160 [Acidobacteria bacterium]|nr:hypothetical protein [Acidobacteriota bacterium]